MEKNNDLVFVRRRQTPNGPPRGIYMDRDDVQGAQEYYEKPRDQITVTDVIAYKDMLRKAAVGSLVRVSHDHDEFAKRDQDHHSLV